MPKPVPTFKGFAFGLLFSLALFAGFLGIGYPYFQALTIVLASILAGAYGYASWQAEALYEIIVSRDFSAERVFEGTEVNVFIKVKNPSGTILYRVEIFDEVPWRVKLISKPIFISSIEPGETKTFVYTIKPMFGRHRWDHIKVAVSDPLGLFRIERSIRLTSGISVAPSWSKVEEWIKREDLTGSSGIVSRTRRGLSLEFFEIRDYQPGDDIRKVVWTATARTGRLMVREDLDEIRMSLHIFLDLSSDSWIGPPGRSPADLMAKIALAILNFSSRSGGASGFTVFYGDGWRSYGPSRSSEVFERLTAVLSIMSPEDSRGRVMFKKALEDSIMRAERKELLILLGPGALEGVSWSDMVSMSKVIRRAIIAVVVPWGNDEVSKAIRILEEKVLKSKEDEISRLKFKVILVRDPFTAWEVIRSAMEF